MDSELGLQAQALLLHDLVTSYMVKPILIANPGLGSEWTATVPGGVIWIPRLVKMNIVTSAVVANREVRLFLDDGTNSFAEIPAPTAITASLTRKVTFSSETGSPFVGATSGNQVSVLPMVPLSPGFRLRSVTTNLDVGDTYSSVTLYVQEISEWGIEWFTQTAVENLATVAD